MNTLELLRLAAWKQLACDRDGNWWQVERLVGGVGAEPLDASDGAVCSELRAERLIRADLREPKMTSIFWSLQLFRLTMRGEQRLARAVQEGQP